MRALGLSVAALAVAMWGALSSPRFLAGYDALSWLLALIPAYLLAYYRGWRGATRAIVVGTLLVLVGELLAEHLLGLPVNWTLLFLVAVALVILGLGLGTLAELLDRERRDALVLAYTDPLTGLANERLLDFVLEKEFAAARRGRPLCVVLFEIDGEPGGGPRFHSPDHDEAIRIVASCIERYMRKMNVSGRIEGGRFLSVLSGENVDGSWVFSERVREIISNQQLPDGDSVTVSVAIGTYEPWMSRPTQLVGAARRGLERAVASGGDRVVYMAEEGPAPRDATPREGWVVERGWRRRSIEEAEIRYRGLFDGVPVGLYRFATSGEILDVNPALVRMLGYPDRENLLSRRSHELYAGCDGDGPWQSSLGSQAATREREVKLRRHDGSTLWARDRARTVLGREGEVRHYQGALIDITERKRAEQELSRSNAKLRALIQAAPLAVIGLDLDGLVTSWNPAAESIFGWSEAEVKGERAPFVPPSARGEFDRLRDRVLEGQYLAGIELPRRRKDGAEIDIRLWAAPLRDLAGSVVGVLGISADVTREKFVERERILLATAVEQVAEAILITNVEGSIQYVNPAFEKITGYSRTEVFGKNPRLLKSGRHEADHYRRLWDNLGEGKPWSGHFLNRRKDGSVYRQETTISPVWDAAGTIVNYVAVARDVTREVELEAQLRQAQKMEAVGQLAGGIAHDFNNLLQAVLGNAEILRMSPEDVDLVRTLAGEIREAGTRAATLTRQLLTFSRRQVLEVERLDLNAVVSEVSKMVERLIGESIELVTDLAPDLALVDADRGQVEQIIVNLAVNSRDAMPNGGRLLIETANVSVGETDVGGDDEGRVGPHVVLAVTDTGIGMDEPTRSRIFEPFFTTKGQGKGTGLGLATVYGIVKQSQGHIRVHSQPGEGTCFTVYLPVAREE